MDQYDDTTGVENINTNITGVIGVSCGDINPAGSNESNEVIY